MSRKIIENHKQVNTKGNGSQKTTQNRNDKHKLKEIVVD